MKVEWLKTTIYIQVVIPNYLWLLLNLPIAYSRDKHAFGNNNCADKSEATHGSTCDDAQKLIFAPHSKMCASLAEKPRQSVQVSKC
jgi:hypothetical protein